MMKRGVFALFAAFLVPACGGGGGGAGPVLAVVTLVTPAETRAGDLFQVIGTDFGAVQGASRLTLAGAPVPVLSWSDTLIQARVPVGGRSGPVAVELPAGAGTPGTLVVLWPRIDPLNMPVLRPRGIAAAPRLAPDGAGGAFAVWEESDDLLLARVGPGGTVLWTDVLVCAAAGAQTFPELVPDEAGGIIVVWQDARGATIDIYAQRLDASGAALWAVDGVLVCGATGAQERPALVGDGAGGALLSWKDSRAGNVDLFAQRIDASGAALWTPNGVVLASAPFIQDPPWMAADGAGGAFVAFAGSDVFAQRVNAAGAPLWGADGVTVCAATQVQFSPRLIPDGAGGAIVAWTDSRAGAFAYDVYVQRLSALGGPLWTADGVALCSATGIQSADALISDGAGGAIVAFSDERTGTYRVSAQRVNALGAPQWVADGVTLTGPSGAQSIARACPDGAGGAVIAWQETGGFDLYAQRVNAAGVAQWTAGGLPLTTASNDQTSHQLLEDGAGGVFAAWTDQRSGRMTIYAQRLNAAGAPQWAVDGLSIGYDPAPEDFSVAASDGAGGAILVFQSGANGSVDLRAQRIDGAGARRWRPDGVPVCAAPDNQVQPSVVADGSGGVIIAWTDTRGGVVDIYAQRLDAGGTALWTLDGLAVCDAAGAQGETQLVSDGTGGALLAWTDERNGNKDVFVQRVSAAGVPLWTADGVALCVAAQAQYAPRLVPDGAGGAIVAWSDSRLGAEDVFAQRVSAAGTPLWTANGVALCVVADQQLVSSVVSDGAGGAIVVWSDRRTGATDVYARRINSQGTPLWTANGVALCTAAADQNGIRAVSDGLGGAVAVWNDHRNGASDLFARRVSALGTPLWAADGVAVSTAAGAQDWMDAVPDGTGGLIAGWRDARSGATHVYAGRIGGDGAPRWAADGVPLCTAAGVREGPVMVADGLGGAVAIWRDVRLGFDDGFYAQLVSALGSR